MIHPWNVVLRYLKCLVSPLPNHLDQRNSSWFACRVISTVLHYCHSQLLVTEGSLGLTPSFSIPLPTSLFPSQEGKGFWESGKTAKLNHNQNLNTYISKAIQSLFFISINLKSFRFVSHIICLTFVLHFSFSWVIVIEHWQANHWQSIGSAEILGGVWYMVKVAELHPVRKA